MWARCSIDSTDSTDQWKTDSTADSLVVQDVQEAQGVPEFHDVPLAPGDLVVLQGLVNRGDLVIQDK